MPFSHFYPLERSERSKLRTLNEMFSDGRSFFPYWRNVAPENALNMGSAVGEIENTAEKFAVSVDVSHFKPQELRVNLSGNELTIEGNNEEKTDNHGTIQRSFIRKYLLPEEANLDSLRTSLSDNGHLSIEAPKKTEHTHQARAIPIMRG